MLFKKEGDFRDEKLRGALAEMPGLRFPERCKPGMENLFKCRAGLRFAADDLKENFAIRCTIFPVTGGSKQGEDESLDFGVCVKQTPVLLIGRVSPGAQKLFQGSQHQ